MTGKPFRYNSSADAAAAFIKSRERRQRNPRARVRKPEQPTPPPAPVRDRQIRTAMLELPLEVYDLLIRHCRNYGIKPSTYIRRSLEMSRLSRGGL